MLFLYENTNDEKHKRFVIPKKFYNDKFDLEFILDYEVKELFVNKRLDNLELKESEWTRTYEFSFPTSLVRGFIDHYAKDALEINENENSFKSKSNTDLIYKFMLPTKNIKCWVSVDIDYNKKYFNIKIIDSLPSSFIPSEWEEVKIPGYISGLLYKFIRYEFEQEAEGTELIFNS